MLMSGGKSILVTGSSGLIGSEVALHFQQQGFLVHGADNNQRAVFFGLQGTTGGTKHGSRR
jgi:CDP-paratose 2-epimerase